LLLVPEKHSRNDTLGYLENYISSGYTPQLLYAKGDDSA
jgi:hypothetical protein